MGGKKNISKSAWCLSFNNPLRKHLPGCKLTAAPRSRRVEVGAGGGTAVLQRCCSSRAERELNCVLARAKSFTSGTAKHDLKMIKYLPTLSIIGTALKPRLGNHFLSSRPGFLKSMMKVSKTTCLHSSALKAEQVFRCHLIIFFSFSFSITPKSTGETPR